MTNDPFPNAPTEPTAPAAKPAAEPVADSTESTSAEQELLDLPKNLHDGFAKHAFTELDVATALWKEHLPAKVAASLDWSTLAVEASSFVKTDLKQIHSDILYSVLCEGKTVLLYLMLEHQTTVDPEMRLRLLRYMLEAWQKFLVNNPRPLPVIIPLVLNQGPETWTPPVEFEKLFNIPEELAAELLPYIPKFRHVLIDLTLIEPAAEELDPVLQVVLQLMKMVRERERDMLAFFEWLEAVFSMIPPHLLPMLLLYALNADKDLDVEKIYRSISSTTQLKDEVMSAAQKLIAQGEARGKALGEARGEARGKIQVLQGLMGKPVSTGEELAAMTLDELHAAFDGLQEEYNARFKR